MPNDKVVPQNTPVNQETPQNTENLQENQEISAKTEISEPISTPEVKKEEVKRLKKLKIKVDGAEFDEDLPFEVEDKKEIVDYLTKQLQLAKVSQKRMAQASDLEKQIGAFLDALKNDPEAVLSDPGIGLNLEEFATKIIQKKIEQSKKTPEQLESEKTKAEFEKLKKELEEKDAVIKQAEMDKLQEKLFNEYNTSVESALKTANLPVNKFFKGMVADYMKIGVEQGIDVKPESVMELVRKDSQELLKAMFEAYPTEVVEEILGKDTIKKFGKKAAPAAPAKPIVTPASATKTVDTGGKKEDSPDKNKKESLNKFPLFKGLGF